MRVWVTSLCLMLWLGSPLAGRAEESPRRGPVELGVLTGFTLFFADDTAEITGSVPSGASGIHAPVTPGLRLTFWNETPFLIDFGLSYFSSNLYDNDFSALNTEFGLGLRTTSASRVVTSASLLVGIVSWWNSSTTTDAYLGGQTGLRIFVNERTSARVQLGYRHTTQGPRKGFDIDAIEIGLGLGVFL